MSLTKINSRLLILLLLHISGSLTLEILSVKCSKERVCAVTGSQVTLSCSYYNRNIQTGFWFSHKQSTNWRKNNEPENVTLDFDYSGRVESLINNYQAELTISDVRERDSGEYQLMFIMKDGVKHLASVAVNLTITELHLRVYPKSIDSRDQTVELTCDSSCTTGNWYYWNKNGKYFSHTGSRNIKVSVKDSGSYLCYQYSTYPSSSVCISQSGCWDVTYTYRRVCALINSTVDIPCTYSHPSDYPVNKTFWHYGPTGVFKNMHEEHQFAGRVEYVENKLRIKELKVSDSGEYRFRIISDKTEEKYSGSPGVFLTVTDTQVISSPDVILGGEKVILSCSTKCTLSGKHTFIWYKNGQQVTDGFTKANKLYLDSVSSEELQEFSCAVGEEEKSTALRNTAIVLCVFLTLGVIGVLWFRWRNRSLFKAHKAEKEEVQYDTVHINTASSDLSKKADPDIPDVYYSSISFSKKSTSNSMAEYPADNTETEGVHYSTVVFK